MTKGISSTFPSLLDVYINSSENLVESPKTKKQTRHKEEKVVVTKKSLKQEKEISTTKLPRQSFHHQSYHQASVRSSTPGERKRIARQQKVEGERLERVADTWDQAKAEVLQERHDQLNHKLVLQHALIKAQDRKALLIRQEEEEVRLRKREENKKQQEEKVSALQDKCKQSLAADRKSKRKAQTGSDTHGRTSGDEDVDRLSEASSPLSGSMDSGGHRRERTKRAGHHGYLPSESYVPATSPMRELMEDEDEEAEFDTNQKEQVPDGVVTPADLSKVPWHHAQLYKMYGRNADYYIHPKMQPEQQKIVNPTLKSQKGHLGASHIWTTLRSDSMNKLLGTDRRFPQELKDAFSSHVREGITKHKKPVFRNFTVTEDVPNIDRLMDESLLRRIRVLRHKTELMYRSSVTNHDRTEILLFSNPLPSVTEGEEGIGKYLPSWDDSVSEDTDATYMRWIKNKKHEDDLREEGIQQPQALMAQEKEEGDENNSPTDQKKKHSISVLSPVGSDVSESLQSIWHSIMRRQRPRKQPKYHFLTEEEARSQGEFLMKLGIDKDKIDRGRTDLLPQLQGHGDPRRSLPSIKAMSAQESRNLRNSVTGHGHSRSESAQNSQSSRFESQWQPLSMNALVEYKEQLATEGKGDFQQGRPKMWNLTTAPQD